MARKWPFTNDMTVGEIDESYLMRTDAVVRNRALKLARNVILLPGGGFTRRWGSERLQNLLAASRVEVTGYGAAARLLIFQAGRFEYRDLDGALLDTVTGCPWAEADLFTMQLASEANRVVVVSRAFYPYVLTNDGAGAWSGADFAFATGGDGRVLQPYFRFAADGVSIQPSAYTGAITVTASAAIFDATWVGKRIRYDGIEILLTAYTDATHVNGTVTGDLYPTYNVAVGSTDGFIAGQTVSGKDSQIDGYVAEITDGTHLKVQMHGSYVPFTNAEILVGPNAFSTISSTSLDATPVATVVWDEQALGNPSVCLIHRTRLLLAGLEAQPNLLMASVIGDITDFDVGTGLDTDAIVETIGTDSTLEILHFGSAEQLLIFTQNGPYYVPEQVAAPLSPTNLEILRISPEVAGASTPLLVSEGMLFTEDGSGRLMVAVPTGNVRRSWDVADLAEMAFHLSGVPREIETLAAGSSTDRLVFQLREDGKIACMTYRRGAQSTGWSLWYRTTGSWRSIVAANSALYVVSEFDGAFFLDRFDPTLYGDSCVSLAWDQDYGVFANRTISVWTGVNKIGDFETDEDGVRIGADDTYSPVTVGFDFPLTVELVPAVDADYGTSRRLRVARAWFDVSNCMPFTATTASTSFVPNGFAAPDFGGLVPAFTGRLSCTFLGHAYDATLTIVQDQGGPLTVRSVTGEIVY